MLDGTGGHMNAAHIQEEVTFERIFRKAIFWLSAYTPEEMRVGSNLKDTVCCGQLCLMDMAVSFDTSQH